MNATARDLLEESLAETIAHVPKPQPGPIGPEPLAMIKTPQSNHRYTFGSGSRPLDGYTIKRAIGRGGFGEVYYATSDAGKEVALKLILRNLEVERRGVVQCMNLKSPNLITVYDIKSNDEGDTFVIMEYVAGPSLANVLAGHPNGMPPQDVRHWLKGLVEGVAYLHDHGIVHRDLKPANLFIEEGVVKIGDYGLSKTITQTQEPGHSESVGTCHYMAPEISSGKYHKPIDVYAMGIILFEMITGRVPFNGETVGEILMKHLTARPDLSPLAEPYRAIVARALAKDPNHRPANVFELLPPDDAPKNPSVRFIGDKTAAPSPAAPSVEKQARAQAQPKPEEEVLHIGVEDSVFYIGPNTWPTRKPGPPPAKAGRWGRFPVVNLRKPRATTPRGDGRPAQSPPPPQQQPQPRVARRPVPPPPAPAPLAPPPPLPNGRVRVAELATSMLMTAPLAAILSLASVVANRAFDVPVPNQVEQIALLFGMILLGTWGVLIPQKVWEGKPLDKSARRLSYLGVGLAVGALGLGFSQWARISLGPFGAFPTPDPELFGWLKPGLRQALGDLTAFAGFFGLSYASNRFWKLTARDRKARFALFPLIGSAIAPGLLCLVWPTSYPLPWGVAAVVSTAFIAQAVSPWSPAAAAYARATRKAA